MKVIYVAGPFRAPNAWEIEQNIRRAEWLSFEVWKLGAACICPHTNTRFFQGAADDDVWLQGDLAILLRCDAVLMVPGWMDSKGAVAEYECAKQYLIPTFLHLDDLQRWLEES